MRLTTVVPARSKSSRFARAIVLLASRASSTTFTFVRCMRGPLHPADLQIALDLGQLHADRRGQDGQQDQHQDALHDERTSFVVSGCLNSARSDSTSLAASSSARRTGSDSSATTCSSSSL